MSKRILLALLLSTAPVFSQNGDHPGEPQPETWRGFDVPPAPVLSAEDALAGLRVAPGFRVELVAAEPMIEDPVAIAWDEHERLWAVEMRGYMPDVDGRGETEPVGQVVILEDLDRDGAMDRSTVFLGALVNPRAVAPVAGGVLIAEPPHLWYARDLDGDLECDDKTEVTTYGNPDPDHLEHTENGLLWAIDNWIYSAKSDRRLRFRGGSVTEEKTLFRGQWGIAQDNYGRLYYNGNSSFLYGDFLPSERVTRNRQLTKSAGQVSAVGRAIVRDEAVHTIRVNPGINRGYQKPMLRPDGRLARTTSVSGLTIYRGGQFPDEYDGDAFVPEPAGNVLAHFRLRDDGHEIKAEHQLVDDPRWGRREFLASEDERFRPVDCAVGPDGALYVVDFYRGILQHRQFVTTFLRKQILDRKLDKPLGLGRIYRVVHEGSGVDRASPPLADRTGAERVADLAHPNGWRRDTAQRLLVEAEELSTIPLLREFATTSASGLGRIHALWTLHGLGAIDSKTIRSQLQHDDPWVRVVALRTASPLFDGPARTALRGALLACVDDPDPRVRVQLMFSLGRFDEPEIFLAQRKLLEQGADDPYLRMAALETWGADLSGVLSQVLEGPASWQGSSGGARFLSEMASALAESNLQGLCASIDRLDPLDEFRATALLDGALRVLEKDGAGRVQLSRRFDLFDRTDLPTSTSSRVRRLLKRLRFSAPTNSVAEPTAEDVARMERSRPLFSMCSLCHGPRGEGVAALGPPLAGSRRTLGPAEDLIRITLHGFSGPLTVGGKAWNQVMPGNLGKPGFDDESIAGLLTWIRQQPWSEERASVVSPEQVRRVREESAERAKPWTAGELDASRSAKKTPVLELEAVEERWFDPFERTDGRSWVVRGGAATYRREADGSIVGTTAPDTPNTFLCTSFAVSDFVLEYEFKVDPELNSGVQIRSSSDPSYRNGAVYGYQVEIDADEKRKRFWTGGIYDESRKGWLCDLEDNPEAREAFRPREWNKIRVIAVGDSIRTWVNGVPAADLVDTQSRTGFIGLQVHGVGSRKDPLEVRWRNLRLLELKSPVRQTLLGPESGTKAWQSAQLLSSKTQRPGEFPWSFEEGVLTVSPGNGSIQTRQAFRDFYLHLEFRVPRDSAELPWDQRGNSGVYLQKRYEVQILAPRSGDLTAQDCGALYGLRKPDSNAALPGGEWQAYDIWFRAARWNAHGEKVENARVTVDWNGERVHNTVELPTKTGAGSVETPTPASLLLQDHGRVVQFRNVWIEPYPATD